MSNPLASFVEAEIAAIAARLGGAVTPAGAWFDGFWDFFVENRERLTRGPAWEISGASQLPWAIEMLAPEETDRPLFELYMFIEAKDSRQGVSAPWPVSSVLLGGASPPEVGARDRFDRPHDPARAESLRRRGFAPLVGYWGVRCEATVSRDEARAATRVQSTLAALPETLPLALALASSARQTEK
jgi:hypothetical protein